MNLNFKRLSLVLLIVPLLCTFLKGQSNKEEIEMYQAIFGMEKKALVAAFIQNEDDIEFWTLYDDYETQRKIFGKERLLLLEEYVENFLNLDNEQAEGLIKKMMHQKKSLDKLIDTYYKKMKKVSGAKKAAQFYQIENYLLSAVRLEILSSIPFIGELDD